MSTHVWPTMAWPIIAHGKLAYSCLFRKVANQMDHNHHQVGCEGSRISPRILLNVDLWISFLEYIRANNISHIYILYVYIYFFFNYYWLYFS